MGRHTGTEAPLSGHRTPPSAVRGMSDRYSERDKGRGPAFLVVLALVALWAAFQNLYRIGVAAIRTDEPVYARAGWRYVHGEVFAPGRGGGLGALADNFTHPPLAKYLFGVAQLVAGGQSITATRVVAALASLGTALAIGWWVASVRGRWLGLVCGAAVALVPESVDGSTGRFGRFGMLDPVAELFMVLSVIAAWHWWRSSGRTGVAWALGTGVLVGLAGSAKENAVLGVVGPVLVLLVEALWRRRGFAGRLGQTAGAVLVSVLVFWALYLPLGHPVARIRYLLDAQLQHSRLGHPVGIAGRVEAHPPWWANFWFAGHGWPLLVTGAVLAGLALVLVLCRDRTTLWCGAALSAPLLFHTVVAGVTLAFYWTMWLPFLLVLSVSGLAALAGPARALGGAPAARGLVAVLVLAGAAVASADTLALAGLEAKGAQRVEAVMRENGLKGPVIVAGLTPVELETSLSHLRLTRGTASPGDTDTVVVGKPRCRVPVDRSVRGLVSLNLKKHRLSEIYSDSVVTVYRASQPLLPPGYLDIVTQPAGNLATGC